MQKQFSLKAHIVTEKSFYKRVLLLIVPVVLQSVINQGVNVMDTVMVGKLGETAISASSLANQFYSIFVLLCMGISAAGLVLSSQYWGAENKATVRRVFDFSMQLVLALGTLFAVLTAFFPKQIMRTYTPEGDVIEAGAKYLRITALIFLPHGLCLVMSNIVRSIGNTRLGLIVSSISFAVNIGANYIFIFGKLGLPAMGVMGAALGTLAARAVEFIVCLVYMLKYEKTLKYRPGGILKPPSAAMLREFRRLGLPAIVSDFILGLAASVISVILGHMGKDVVSAYAIVTVLDRICTVATMGIASASSVVIGQTVGSGNVRRAQREGWSFLLMSAGMGLLSASLVLVIGRMSVEWYNITGPTHQIAAEMMLASALIVFFQTIQSTTTKGILRGGGDTKFLMVADVVFQWCASIPLGYLAGLVLGLPPFWVLLALRIDYIIKAVWMFFRMRSGKWIHKVKSI